MKKILTFIAAAAAVVLSCTKEEKYNTDQISRTSEVVLTSYGPRPVLRGGELRFVGSNLDQVVSITFPEDVVVTDINVVTSGVPSEIRVTVPQEAQPGYLVLTTKGGKTITTETELSYIENISLEGFSPASVYPGDEITISGDYLNLVHEVIFSSNVFVSEADFTEHSRTTIKVLVPVAAKTGVIGVGDMDETLLEDDKLEANRIYTEEELTVGTASITSIECDDTREDGSFKAGSNLIISGTHFELVSNVLVSGMPIEDYTLSAEEGIIEFVLPDNLADGTLSLEMLSGVMVDGDEITFVKFQADEPTVTSLKPGASFTVSGKDLDLVTGAKLSYSTLAFQVADDGNSITLTTDASSVSGKLVLTSNAGQVFTSETRIEIEEGGEPSATEILLWEGVCDLGNWEGFITEDQMKAHDWSQIEAGSKLCVEFTTNEGKEADGYQLGFQNSSWSGMTNLGFYDFTAGDTHFEIALTQAALDEIAADGIIVKGKNMTVNKLYVKVESIIPPEPSEETVLWEGTCDLGNWEGFITEDQMNAHDWTLIQAGSKLCVEFTTNEGKEADGYQLGFQNGSWSSMTNLGFYDFVAGDTHFEITLTQAALDEIAADGIIVKGKNMTVTKVYVKAGSVIPEGETLLWEGTCDLGNWEGFVTEDQMNPHDWSQVEAGSKLCVDFTTNEGKDEDGYQLGFQNSSWSGMTNLGFYDFTSGDTHFEIELTQDALDEIAQDGIIVKGKNLTLSKIYLK